MKQVRNIFICLVHENQDCVIDLVRNLKFLDGDSQILLYNGGEDENLFRGFPFDEYGVMIHPAPKRMKWGWLHDFALDCMRYALDHLEFDVMTVVDSDQLCCEKGYSKFISSIVLNNPNLGMLGTSELRQERATCSDPVSTALQEEDLWLPLMDSLPNGDNALWYWTFWPSTVFTQKACKALVNIFDTNEALQKLLNNTKIWASEEVILPTLVHALGFDILKHPTCETYVNYKQQYSYAQIEHAIFLKESFWIHPVPRDIDNEIRQQVYRCFDGYARAEFAINERLDLVSTFTSIWNRIDPIEGWLSMEEAEMLHRIVDCVGRLGEETSIVEVGAYCGRSTAVMGLTALQNNSNVSIYPIDSFSGELGALDTGLYNYGKSFARFKRNIVRLELNDSVKPIRSLVKHVDWEIPIDILLIDGWHDYASVAKDFYQFEPFLKDDGIVLFHDYCTDFVGVLSFVNELGQNQSYQCVGKSGSLIAFLKGNKSLESKQLTPKIKESKRVKRAEPQRNETLVSCIMPTCDRPNFISNSIDYFLNQDYCNKELLIIDDGVESIEHLVPDVENIRYKRLDHKKTIGYKRNLACQQAEGEIIIHWDDDDWYAEDWISIQVDALVSNKLEITGLSNPLFYNEASKESWQYSYPDEGMPWVHGATLCYTKAFWLRNKFKEINLGEDNEFIWSSNSKKIRSHGKQGAYVGRIHSDNTSPKETDHVRWNHKDLARPNPFLEEQEK